MTPRQTRAAIRAMRLRYAHARQVRRIVATYKAVRQA